MRAFLDFIDQRKVMRRLGYVALWGIVFWGFDWSIEYADAALAAGRPGVDTAAVIAAVWAPISMLAGYVFRVYSDGRSREVAAGPTETIR